jgi:DNA-binding NarL/FixJ family response regulator
MPSKAVLLINDDLFFTARLASVLRKAGFTAQVCSDAAAAGAPKANASIAIVNLACRKFDPLATVRVLKRGPDPPRVLAFYSHTLIPKIKAEAMAAGVDRLVPNSAIFSHLPKLLNELAMEAGSEV